MTNIGLSFLVVLLGVTVLIVPVTARLGLGSVIGYLFGGLLVGPSVFGLISNPEEILHMAEFGVVMLLFLIGLELNTKRLWKLRRSIFGMGLLQVVLSAAALGSALWFGGWGWKAALIAGLAGAMSSTAIAMQVIAEKGLRNHPAGENGFSILLFQDLAVIPILLLVGWLSPDLVSTGSALSGVWRVIAPILAVVMVVIFALYLSRPIFRWIAGTRSRELSLSFSLLIVIGIAYLMQAVGLSMALGAFIAGVILAESEYRHELEANIEPFKGLLLGLFFLAVGMGIRLDFVKENLGQVILIVSGLLLLKFGILALLARIFQMHWRSGLVMGILLSQGGEFAFVLFGQALAGQILSEREAALLNAAITLSMLSTPLLMLLYDRFGAATPKDGQKPHDTIEDYGNPVIIAGFGRVGQVVSRLLSLNGITCTLIDHDAEQVEAIRKFGYKTFYGDASNMAILEAAGISHCRLLVIAIDDRDMIGRLAEEVKRHYPNLPILTRAFDRPHLYELMDIGLRHIHRETFGSALEMGRDALEIMGLHPYDAHRVALRFKHYDLESIKRLHPFHKDEKQIISRSREARETLEKLFAQDADRIKRERSIGWD